MGWPQYVYMALTLIGLGVILSEHGKPKTGRHNFWFMSFVTAFIYFLLYSGGFFKGF